MYVEVHSRTMAALHSRVAGMGGGLTIPPRLMGTSRFCHTQVHPSRPDARLGSFQQGACQAGRLLGQPAGVLKLLRQVLEDGGDPQRVCVGLGHLPACHPKLARPHRARISLSPCGIAHHCTVTKPFQPCEGLTVLYQSVMQDVACLFCRGAWQL